MSVRELCERWRMDLEAWAIPDEIMANATESPWVLPRAVFTRRAERYLSEPSGPSYEAAWAALDPRGAVLDVGSGAGAASLPLIPRANAISAVDTDQALLDALAQRATDVGATARTVLGRWPDIGENVEPADVVTCHHVLYNVPDIEPFIRALTDHASRLVVAEITARHPLASLNPLWRRFHGIERPAGPTADDAIAVLLALGLDPRVRRWRRAAMSEYASFADLVDVTRRRLCLPAQRAEEVGAALRELGMEPGRPQDVGSSGRELVTISWPGTAP